jgi:DNA polymerase-3 subunit gamma/tau
LAYQVLARKWRPQRFDDVVGQQAVTRTLKNAIASGRIAHAFVFAGPRGCGKTTTARILARALNCTGSAPGERSESKGPTAEPCGECEACLEIAQGRDIDVLEIDAASHTGIDNIREVVIAGLAIAPVRDRYKIFIIDEVHQLSTPSFNALLKSIEEPPAHVVFMMATTELHKIPDTILSRSQVFEFRAIPSRAIAAQLRMIAGVEKIEVSDAALALIARSADGSMRDAQSALDQVIAFAGTTITLDDVSTVLGLVGRELLFDIVSAVVDEDAPRAFALADRAVESGHDLRLVCRELSRVVRDIMVLSVDPARAGDGELAEGELEQLKALGARFSREDLMRAFDLLSKAEQDIRTASHARYYFEMVLLRWMHLRKLVPLTDLMEQMGGARTVAPAKSAIAPGPKGPAPTPSTIAPTRSHLAPSPSAPAPARSAIAPSSSAPAPAESAIAPVKDRLLAEIRTGKQFFYNTVVAQAQRIDVAADRITFTFLPTHRALKDQFEQTRPWLESIAEKVAGRKVTVAAVQAPASDPASVTPPREEAPVPVPGTRDLIAEAKSSPAVQAMLDVFQNAAEIRDVEDM